MKVYKIENEALISPDPHSNLRETQTVLYIPNQGVLVYIGRTNDYLFHDDAKSIANAEEVIKGNEKATYLKYLGEFDLPDEAVLKAISAGKVLNQSTELFKESTKKLVDLIKE